MNPPSDAAALHRALETLDVDPVPFLSAFERLQWIDVAPGTTLARQGERCDALFVVLEGALDVLRDEAPIARLESPNVVGEGQILSGGIRTATVRAATPCRVVRLSAAGFADKILDDAPFVQAIVGLASRRQRHNRLADYLRSTLGLDEPALVARLVEDAAWQPLGRGDVVIRHGEAGNALYLVVEGRLRVTDARGRFLSDILPGAIVGEIELFSGGIRTATVTATRASLVARFDSALLRDAMRTSPTLAARLATLAVQRMMRSTAMTRADWASVNVTVISADPAVSPDEFAVRLERELSAMGKVAVITRSRVADALGQAELCDLSVDDPRATRLRAWRSEMEADHDFVVFVAERGRAPWTLHCLDGSDIVVTLARPRTPPTPGIGDTLARRWLVVVHDDARGCGVHTARITSDDPVSRQFHVRSGVPKDFARLARAIAGREVGLVLSGGGARSFAHLGTIQALDESGVPIDVLGGTSAGACVAAFYSLGLRGKALETTLREVLGGWVDFTIPLYAVARGRAMRRRMSGIFGELELEDLPLPVFCVATNISQFGLVEIDRGPVVNAVLASACLPGIFPPVKHNGHLMVDGGLVNAMPVDRMRALVGPRGVVLASNVTGGSEPPESDGWLWRTLGGPLVSDVVSRAVAAAGEHQLRGILEEGRPEMCIHHETAMHSPVDFADPTPLRERGLAATLAALEPLLAQGLIARS